MSVRNYSSPDYSRGMCSHGGVGRCVGGHWSGANIAAMVLGFLVFAPLGFVVLLWTIMGRPIQDLPTWVRDKWVQFFRSGHPRTSNESDNIVFNEYQQTQYDRIHEIKEEIKKRAEAFRTFRFDAKRHKDQQEFEEFMASNPEKGQGKT
jgi:hypothetical protein